MYETQSQTNGLHRGFDECEMSQARCFAGGILPARQSYFCGAIALLSATGILLIALAGAIIWLTETYNLPWLPFVLAGLELWFIVRMVDQ